MTNVLFIFVLAAVFIGNYISQGLVLPNNVPAPSKPSLWQPENGTSRNDWMSHHGMSADEYTRTQDKLKQLKTMLSQKFGPGIQSRGGKIPLNTSTSGDGDTLDGCIWLTEGQIDKMMKELDQPTTRGPRESGDQDRNGGSSHQRKKRKLYNFVQDPSKKWTFPIPYKFDGSHNENQKGIIRNAFQHWMDNTCVRFRELSTGESYSSNHILITNVAAGCYSYVGRIQTLIPQPLNLQDPCLYRFGVPVHEIGHSLGLWHEQQRADRDLSIRIVPENLYSGSASQFMKADTLSLGVQYNLGSVMHYPSKDGVSVNGLDVMLALDPLYQQNMGQRTGLSFFDTKIINLAYCQDVCPSPMNPPCLKGGYQNPNNCSSCICPDGFSGRYCEQVAPSKNAVCGGTISISSDTMTVVKSPGYDDAKSYQPYQECSWWIKAPTDRRIKLDFIGEFGVYCEYSACFHWVEVKYKSDLGLEGPRFCCDQRPNVTVTSESNEMMIVFRSNYSAASPYFTRGFQAIVRTDDYPATTPTTTTTTSPPSSSRSPSSTTTAATTKLTTPSNQQPPSSSSLSTTSTTTKSPPSSSVIWQCSFEPAAGSSGVLCGMIQDQTDQFDWTVYTGPTPSDPTGPDAAFERDYYIYIEASAPRQPNDQARITFPDLNFSGDVCVDFYYHMYGFHIRTLNLILTAGSSQTVLWTHSNEIGNYWMHGSANATLSGSSTQLRFVGVRGDEYSGDIGLDKLQILSGRCR